MCSSPWKGCGSWRSRSTRSSRRAGAVLAGWGAEVIKVEHAVRGDAQRGVIKTFGMDVLQPGSSFEPMMDGLNRGKRSIGLALENAESRPVLEELVRRSDVFLTNFLPSARASLKIAGAVT